MNMKGIHMNNLTETNHASKSLGIFASKTVSCRHSNADLQKKVAFTLAEVLITLGIIGVVAALTLPTVIKHYKAKVLETAFKKVSQTFIKPMISQDTNLVLMKYTHIIQYIAAKQTHIQIYKNFKQPLKII